MNPIGARSAFRMRLAAKQLAECAAVSDFDSFSQLELDEIAEQFRRGFGV